MTDTIPGFSITEGGNNQAAALFPENLPPTNTTDNLRRLQAAIRQQWNQAQWFNLGDLDRDATYSFLSGTRFRLQGATLATEYHIGRRVRARGTLTGVIVGSITAVAQTGGNTDVTVNWDSGSLSNENFEIELSIISAIASSLPTNFSVGASFSGDSSVDGDFSVTGALDVVGAITAASATFNTVNFTSGPFNIISAIRRNNGGVGVPVPIGTKQIILEIWGAGGGGSSDESTIDGAAGGNFTISSDPAGREINVPGGLPGGSAGTSGQDLLNGAGITSSGTFKAILDVVNGGSPGGAGAGNGIGGNAGHFVKAIIDATENDITQFLLSGGAGGQGGTESGDSDGGNGGRAVVIATFYG